MLFLQRMRALESEKVDMEEVGMENIQDFLLLRVLLLSFMESREQTKWKLEKFSEFILISLLSYALAQHFTDGIWR